jgi:hypothetical protein
MENAVRTRCFCHGSVIDGMCSRLVIEGVAIHLGQSLPATSFSFEAQKHSHYSINTSYGGCGITSGITWTSAATYLRCDYHASVVTMGQQA